MTPSIGPLSAQPNISNEANLDFNAGVCVLPNTTPAFSQSTSFGQTVSPTPRINIFGTCQGIVQNHVRPSASGTPIATFDTHNDYQQCVAQRKKC